MSEDYVRSFTNSDHDGVSMLIGQSLMESLARANQRAYFYPLTLVVWIAAGLGIDYALDYRPKPDVFLSSLKPLIGFAMAAMPIMGWVEYLHRPVFTAQMRATVGAQDLVDPARYYALDPRSTVLVFVHKGDIAGVVAVDGARAAQAVPTVLGDEEGLLTADTSVMDPLLKASGKEQQQEQRQQAGKDARGKLLLRQRKKAKNDTGVSSVSAHPDLVEIRHLAVDLPVRRNGVATELLAAALDRAFGTAALDFNSTSETGSVITAAAAAASAAVVGTGTRMVVVRTNAFTPGGDSVFTHLGFTTLPRTETDTWAPVAPPMGVLRWQGKWMGIDRATWVNRRAQLFK